MRRHVVPRHALGIRKRRLRHPAVRREVVALPRVEMPHKRVRPCLRNRDALRPSQSGAVGVKCRTPRPRRACLGEERARAVVIVERSDSRENVDEDAVRRGRLTQKRGVAIEPRTEAVGQRAIALRTLPVVVPRLVGRAVRIEDDPVVREAVRVRVVVDVVVVRHEEPARTRTRLAQPPKRRRVAARRTDVRQPVVIPPPLPVVLDEDRVPHAVFRRAGDIRRHVVVVDAPPLVEAHPPQQRFNARSRPVAAHVAKMPRGGERALRRRHERERGVVARDERVLLPRTTADKRVGENIRSLHERKPVLVVRADMARREVEPRRRKAEVARLLDHVPEARVSAFGGQRPRSKRQARVAWLALRVARHAGHVPSHLQRTPLRPDPRTERNGLPAFVTRRQPMRHDRLRVRRFRLHARTRPSGQRTADGIAIHFARETTIRQLTPSVRERQHAVEKPLRTKRPRRAEDALASLQRKAEFREIRPVRTRGACGLSGGRLTLRPVGFRGHGRHLADLKHGIGPSAPVAGRVHLRSRPDPEAQRDGHPRPRRQINRPVLPCPRGAEARKDLRRLFSLDYKNLVFRAVACGTATTFPQQRRREAERTRPRLRQDQRNVAPDRARTALPRRMTGESGPDATLGRDLRRLERRATRKRFDTPVDLRPDGRRKLVQPHTPFLRDTWRSCRRGAERRVLRTENGDRMQGLAARQRPGGVNRIERVQRSVRLRLDGKRQLARFVRRQREFGGRQRLRQFPVVVHPRAKSPLHWSRPRVRRLQAHPERFCRAAFGHAQRGRVGLLVETLKRKRHAVP